ncbi:FtsQ-type POTRA domain-containing protein [Clostridium paridis]|uniref:FtsQ-type POTRA domain-containing protein n=1 Tax=Clostridium paridis TaxID=2803863 RepID=A0A937K4C5_9CLOT|nr:FtsQ-type POTRA domain-containing protein [Clostridium paridis]
MQPQNNKYIEVRRKKQKIKKLLALFILFLGLFILFLLKAPTFNISQISVKNNNENPILKEDYISGKLNAFKGKNIFSVKRQTIEEVIEKEAYVKEAKVSKKLPNKVSVDIIEKKPTFSIEDNGETYILDEEGKIIEIKNEKGNTALINLKGININNKSLGSYITKDEKMEKLVGSFGKLFAANTSNIKFSLLDLSDTTNINIYYGEVMIRIGSEYTLQNKLNSAINILKSHNMTKGYIDVRFNTNPIIVEE